MKHLLYIILALIGSAAVASAQEVVINKFCNNGEKDTVELLVIKNHLDMRGMMLKDFARDKDNVFIDSGGVYRFASAALWSSVPSGTLIVLYRDSISIDTSTNDFVLKLSLSDERYFEHIRGQFDIRSDGEMLMIKRAGSSDAWMDGSIHAFACASFSKVIQDSVPKPFLYVTCNASTNKSIIAKNSARQLSDYSGRDGDSTSSFLFGTGNTTSNQQFIDSLRLISRIIVEPPLELDFCVLYPNPAQSLATLAAGTSIHSVDVIDLLGRTVMRLTPDKDITTLPLSDISNGAFMLHIQCSNYSYQRLLIIQR